jgi:hypothetical protein
VTRIRSLILNDSDVRSVLDGTKRMHAVAVKAVIPEDLRPGHRYRYRAFDGSSGVIFCRSIETCTERMAVPAPYRVGDMVWVREAFADSDERAPHYRADFDNLGRGGWDLRDATHGHVTVYRWRPATNMRRDESRLTLRVTDVSVERNEGGQWTWMVAFERVEPATGPIIEGACGHDREGGTE